MSLKAYLTLMSVGTVLCWVAWFFVIFNIAPDSAGTLGIIFFYFSLFLAIVGTFSVFGFLIRRAVIREDEIVFRHVRHTFRQSILIALLAVTYLLLLSNKMFYWWNAGLLLIFFIFIEAIIFSSRKHNNA